MNKTNYRGHRRLIIEELEPRYAPGYAYFPSPAIDDARFLALCGTNVSSLNGDYIQVEFAAPTGATQLEIGIFDGETGNKWDLGSVPLEFSLYADPSGDGANAGNPSALKFLALGNSMPDNDWYTISITTGPDAQSPSGTYFYTMLVRNTNPSLPTTSVFKVRTDESVFMLPKAFSFMAPVGTNTATIVYPEYPSLTPTTYDGTWDFSFYVPTSTERIVIWDGDMDYGAWDGSYGDTDDPDTPNAGVPEWAVGTGAKPEGVAVGYKNSTGLPGDDTSQIAYLRQTGIEGRPGVIYRVTDPNGNTYWNYNPSGNLEWEQFRIETNPEIPADYHVAGPLPAGVYQVRLYGADMANLNAWRFTYNATATPYRPPQPYLIGDTVWMDSNANGQYEPETGEVGVAGVTVELIDSLGSVIGTATTDEQGRYQFDVPSGTFTVRVAPENFIAGGPLCGFVTSTGNELTRTVEAANVLTYDFGYTGAAIGNYVWHDLFHSVDHAVDGIQDADEPGLANVLVQLKQNGQVIASTTTDASGYYLFQDLLPGTYTVKIADSNFATGGLLEGWYVSQKDIGGNDALDSDGHTTTHEASVTVAAGERNLNTDFGFFRVGISLEKTGPESVVFGPQVALAPEDGSTYVSPNNHYYTVQNPTDNPFYSIKFEEQGSGIKKGASDSFTYVISSDAFDPNLKIHVEAKAGNYDRNTYLTPTPGSTATVGSFKFTFVSALDDGATTAITISVKNSYSYGLSHVSFGLPLSEVITYHFRVENTGDLVLHGGAHVYDPLLNPSGDHEIWSAVVWPGEVYEFDKKYTPCGPGTLVNNATAIGHPEHPGNNGKYEEGVPNIDDYYVSDVYDAASWTVSVLGQGGGSSSSLGGETSRLLRGSWPVT